MESEQQVPEQPQAGIHILVPQITKDEVQKHAKNWKYNGLVVPLDDVGIQFATDMVNGTLSAVVPAIIKGMLQQVQQVQQAQQKPSIIE